MPAAPTMAVFGLASVALYKTPACSARRPALSLSGHGGGVRRGHYQLIRLLRVGDHRAVSACDLDYVGAHPLCELPLRIGRNHFVVFGDQIPRGKRLPSGGAHHVVERGHVQRLLDGVHDLRLDWVDIGSEVTEEVVLGDPG